MLYKYLPYCINKRLFGDRKRYGIIADFNDKDYIEALKSENVQKFYNETQKNHIGKIINHYGFNIIKYVKFTDKTILEVGPGSIEHLDYNSTKPKKYILADIRQDFLDISENRLKYYNIKNVKKIRVRDINIPLQDNSIDILISFHQFEHIYRLDEYLKEIKRILKPNGLIVGAVPTEGSLAWGLGRCLTSNRYVKKNMNFNYNKIICWEHPNFVNKIKNLLDRKFKKIKSIKKPFRFLPFDLNLSWSFIYRNTMI